MFAYALILVARGSKWSKIVDLFLPLQILVLFRNPKDTAVSFFHFHNNVPSVPSYSSWDEFFSEFMNGKGIVVVTECSWRSNRKKIYLKTKKWGQWENSCVIISLLIGIRHDKRRQLNARAGERPKDALLLGILHFQARVRKLHGSWTKALGQHSAMEEVLWIQSVNEMTVCCLYCFWTWGKTPH